ncbi:hypothetical protein B0H17DRAFT_1042999 [Mycena rosella]|uniref:F-box domain-containing protein n=1 Tax=Mycena rosella TaxID=1033263 RepID=A0AAD7DYN4_MYCRO|nr:hypothetical protein B0H17DRAFT_1042999 [Mycena rosella]
MPLQNLNPDVLLVIFALVDVATILSLSRVNKAFNAISSAKQLWLSVVRDLSSRWLIDLPGNQILDTCSTAELIAQVKRGVLGPQTWSPTCSASPTLMQQINIPVEGLQGSRVGEGFRGAQFLPDGRHFLLYPDSGLYVGGVECWEVHSMRRLWGMRFPSAEPILTAAFDFRGGGLKAVVIIVFIRHTIVLETDMQTGQSHQYVRLPLVAHAAPRIQIWGDFLAWNESAAGRRYRPQLFLLNWRNAEIIFFDVPDMEANLALFPGHLLLTFHDPHVGSQTIDHARIYSLASLANLWCSCDHDEDPSVRNPEVSLAAGTALTDGTLPSVSFDIPVNEQQGVHYIRPSITQSLLRDETYQLVIEVVDLLYPVVDTRRGPIAFLARRIRNQNPFIPGFTTTVSRYQLVCPAGPSLPPVPRLTSVFRHQKEVVNADGGGIAIGYALCRAAPVWRDTIAVRRLDEAGIRRPRELPMEGPKPLDAASVDAQISRTGAVMSRGDNQVTVCYYL